jgi:hypothetical protein
MGHTTGPWYSHLYLSVACENDGEYGSATCITNTPEDEYAATGNSGDWVAFIPHDGNHAANARLIAAAPTLLCELKRLLSLWEEAIGYEKDYMDMGDPARAAIAKAEGGKWWERNRNPNGRMPAVRSPCT